jgi:hypothetical protein
MDGVSRKIVCIAYLTILLAYLLSQKLVVIFGQTIHSRLCVEL